MSLPAPPSAAGALTSSLDDGYAGDEGLVLEAGRVIAKKYVLDRPAGFGGMAALWVATNQSTGAEVCIKLLVPDSDRGHDAESIERFRREAHAAASLSHRAIVRVFDLFELDVNGDVVARGADPHAYAMVMELLHGETLGDMLAKRGKLPLEEALDLFLPVVSALAHAHRASVIHRDIKPDNIFLASEPDGHVIPKVLDFGVSKLERADALTSDGVVVGTAMYMSPEQARGRRIDARSDVFSAGILLYMMLTGRNPFEDAPTFDATIDAIIRKPVAPIAELDPSIWSVIERAIQKEPAGRWNDCTEMGVALRKASGRRATTASDPSIPLLSISTPISSRHPVADAPGRDGVVSDPSPSFTAAADVKASTAAKRRRAVALAVVGAAALTALVALLLSLLGPKGDTDASRPAASAPLRATTTPVAKRKPTPPPEPAPTSVPEAPAVASSAPPTEVAAEPTSPVVAPASPENSPPAAKRAAAGPGPGQADRAGRPRGPSSPPTAKSGEPAHIARDPGF